MWRESLNWGRLYVFLYIYIFNRLIYQKGCAMMIDSCEEGVFFSVVCLDQNKEAL